VLAPAGNNKKRLKDERVEEFIGELGTEIRRKKYSPSP